MAPHTYQSPFGNFSTPVKAARTLIPRLSSFICLVAAVLLLVAAVCSVLVCCLRLRDIRRGRTRRAAHDARLSLMAVRTPYTDDIGRYSESDSSSATEQEDPYPDHLPAYTRRPQDPRLLPPSFMFSLSLGPPFYTPPMPHSWTTTGPEVPPPSYYYTHNVPPPSYSPTRNSSAS